MDNQIAEETAEMVKRLASRLVSVDVETTGLDPVENAIVQLGAVHVQTGEEFYSDVRMPYFKTWTVGAYEVNGLTVAECTREDRPSRKIVVSKFVRWLEDLDMKGGGRPLFAAHNVQFDSSFMQQIFEEVEVNWPFSYRQVDLHSVALSQFLVDPSHIKPDSEKFNLNTVAKMLGFPEEPEPHNALIGATYCAACLSCLMGVDGLHLGEWEERIEEKGSFVAKDS